MSGTRREPLDRPKKASRARWDAGSQAVQERTEHLPGPNVAKEDGKREPFGSRERFLGPRKPVVAEALIRGAGVEKGDRHLHEDGRECSPDLVDIALGPYPPPNVLVCFGRSEPIRRRRWQSGSV